MLSLDVSVDLGFATLSSATSYVDSNQEMRINNAGLYAALSGLYFGYPEDQIVAPSFFEQGSKVLTQEFRLVSQGDGDWDWVVGAWYKDQEQDAFFNDTIPGYDRWASDPSSSGSQIVAAYYPGAGNTVADFWGAYYQGTPNPILDDPYVQNREMEFEDIAVFGELTYHISDKWQVTGGFRQFWQEFSQTNAIDFNILGPDFAVRAKNDADFDDSIFKFNTSYDLSDNTMVYFTWSEGFRHGGANGFPTSGTGAVTSAPVEYDSDEATNYEIGIKGTMLDDRVRYSAAAYRIDWDRPQLDVFLGLLAVPSVVNGDKAQSQGLELEVTAQFSPNFTGTFGWSYTDAELQGDGIAVEDTSGDFVTANKGDPMPGVPEHQVSLALNYFQPLDNGTELHYFLTGSYKDKVVTSFNDSFADYAELDDFAIWDAGANWNLNNWLVGLYVKNIGNEVGLNGVRVDRPDFNDHGFISRPRSYGLKVSYTF
jgi:outer membrane receptor protein involved in Fe transport